MSRERGASIRRLGESPRWADVTIHRGVARWVEVAEDPTADARGQIAQVLAQVDATLQLLGADKTRLLQVLVYLADLADGGALNELWDPWVEAGEAPVRACVQAGLGGGCRVELVLTAAVDEV